MPGAIPRRPAPSFTAKTFSSGGLPSKIATARARNSGSARNIAATGRFGTKMQANMKQYPVPSCQYPILFFLATGYWQLTTVFSSRPGGFAGESDFGGTNWFAIHAGSRYLRCDFQFGQQLRMSRRLE